MAKTTLQFETEKFNAALKTFLKKSDIDSGKVIKRIAFVLLGHIIGDLPGENKFGLDERALAESKGKSITGRHPVDTGRARAGWYASVRGLGGTYDFTKSGSGGKGIDSKKISQGQSEGSFVDNTKSPFMKYVDLINGVDYIMYLEYGYSAQAPAGMVRISMKSMYETLPKTMGKQYLADWNRLGI